MSPHIFSKKPRIFFMHVPKTGGTSVNSAIQRHYGRQSYILDPIRTKAMAKLLYQSVPSVERGTYILRDSFILDAMNRDVSYISGHAHFNHQIWEHYSQNYAYVTLLRDPVKRYISNYFFDASKDKGDHSYVEQSLSDFVKTNRGIRRGHFFSHKVQPPTLDKSLEAELIDYLRPDINRLRDYTGLAFENWCL